MKDSKIIKKAEIVLKNELLALGHLNSILNKDFIKAVNILERQPSGKIVVIGIGKSGHIGIKIASTMTSLGVPAIFLHPGEALHGDLGLMGLGDSLLAISYSGETKEVLKIAHHAKRHKIPVVSIAGNNRSSLAKISDIFLNIKIKEEGSPFNLAPMASAVATLALGDMLAAALSSKRGFTKKDFADFHPGGSLGLRLTKVQELVISGKKLPIVKENDNFHNVLKTISNKKLGITAVVNKLGKLLGVISDGDIRRFFLSGKFSDKSLARDAMTSHPKTIGQDESLQSALSKMESHKITSLFVVSRFNVPVGIITMHDIIESKML